MSNYSRSNSNRGGRDGNFRRDRGSRGGRERNFDRPQMFSVVCDDCGRDCEVPFKPSSDKPIYCDDCFKNHKNDNSYESNSRSDFRERSFSGRDNFRGNAKDNDKVLSEILNLSNKLDRLINILESKDIEPKKPAKKTSIKKPLTKEDKVAEE